MIIQSFEIEICDLTGADSMFKDKQSATELNSVLQEICKLIDKGRDLVHSGNFSEQDRRLYNENMAKVMGNEIFDVLGELWREHPELIPPGAQPWPADYSPTQKKKKQLAEPESTEESSNNYSLKHTATAKGLIIEICFAKDTAQATTLNR